MARKTKNLASFGEVANINDNSNNKIKKTTKETNTKKEDFLDLLIEGNQKKKTQQKVTGIYLEPEIEKILDQLAKKGGKGAKSKIVNEALKKIFKQKGLV